MENKIGDIISPTKGFFSTMEFDFRIIEKSQLDLMFFNLFSQKTVSPFCYYYLQDLTDDGKISDVSLRELSNLILNYYKLSWGKILDTLEIEYDPIHNFSDDVTEDINGADDKTVTVNMTKNQTGSGTITRTDNLTSTDTKDLTDTTNGSIKDEIAGFNSSSFKNKDNSTENSTVTTAGTDTVENTGTQTRKEERNFNDKDSGTNVTDDDFSKHRTLVRKGNIGNITTQQMMQQEIELWKNNFVRLILDNVRDLTTVSVYL